MAARVVCKIKKTGNLSATHDYIEKSAVYTHGTPAAEMAALARKGDNRQGLHIMGRAQDEHPTTRSLDKTIAAGTKAMDHFRRHGYQCFLGVHELKDPDTGEKKYHWHLLVNTRNKRTMKKLHWSDREQNDFWRKVHAEYDSTPDRARTKSAHRLDREADGTSWSKYRRLDEASGPLITFDNANDITARLKEISAELTPIYAEMKAECKAIDADFRELREQAQSAPQKSADAPTAGGKNIVEAMDISGEPGGYSAPSIEGLHLDGEDLAQIAEMGFLLWLCLHATAAQHEAINGTAAARAREERRKRQEAEQGDKRKRKGGRTPAEMTPRKTLPPHILERIARIDGIAARIKKLRNEREEFQKQKIISAMDTQRQIMGGISGTLIVRCVLKDDSGKAKLARTYTLKSRADCEKMEPVLMRLNGEQYHIFAASGEPSRTLCVDDLSRENLRRLPRGAYIVRTSDDGNSTANYTAVIRLDRDATKAEQDAIIDHFKGDPGGKTGTGSTRLVGFRNWKHSRIIETDETDDNGEPILKVSSPIVRHISKGTRTFSADALLAICHYRPKIEEPPKIERIRSPQSDERHAGHRKTWAEFAVSDDRSKTDFAYACYCLSCGLTITETARKLEEVSPQRGKHKTYWLRTALAADDFRTKRRFPSRERGRSFSI